MTNALRLSVVAAVAIVVWLLSLFLLGAMGLGRFPYLEFPLVLFITTLVLWPVAVRLLGFAARQRFADWAAFSAAFTLMIGLILWSVAAWNSASPFLDEIGR